MRILIAPDKFKGSLSARKAAEAIAKGARAVFPDAILQILPIADGGEGFAEVLSKRKTSVAAHDALGREIVTDYGWMDESTAVIEMSATSGLTRIAPHECDPLRATSLGTGELIEDAIKQGAKKILVGLGGSATNDGGAGMATALGYEFVTSDGEPLVPLPANLLALMHIKPLERDWPEIIAASDVQNPLLGAHGASCIYGPQKGADSRAVETLELALEQLAEIVAQDFGCDFRDVPGAGAAGGMGFGLMSFCNARIRSGFELVAEVLEIEKAVAENDLIITGEGRVDAQTLAGKGPAGIAALARKHAKPVIAFAGSIEKSAPRKSFAEVFDAMIEIAPPQMPLEESMRNATHLLEAAAHSAMQKIRAGKLLSRPLHLSS